MDIYGINGDSYQDTRKLIYKGAMLWLHCFSWEFANLSLVDSPIGRKLRLPRKYGRH